MTPTSDERREVAATLRDAKRKCEERGYPWMTDDLCLAIGYEHDYEADNGIFDRLADLIDPTCVYEPTETLTRWDENDYEHETNEPDFDCTTFACSRCGYEMLYGYECGWFDTEPPYAPHFKFCPNCSARVLPLKLYDKVVTNDGE